MLAGSDCNVLHVDLYSTRFDNVLIMNRQPGIGKPISISAASHLFGYRFGPSVRRWFHSAGPFPPHLRLLWPNDLCACSTGRVSAALASAPAAPPVGRRFREPGLHQLSPFVIADNDQIADGLKSVDASNLNVQGFGLSAEDRCPGVTDD